MPKYFFDVGNDGKNLTNDTGIEVPNLQVAVREAIIVLAEMTEDITTGVLEPEISIEIRDEEDEVVAEVTLTVDLKGDAQYGAYSN